MADEAMKFQPYDVRIIGTPVRDGDVLMWQNLTLVINGQPALAVNRFELVCEPNQPVILRADLIVGSLVTQVGGAVLQGTQARQLQDLLPGDFVGKWFVLPDENQVHGMPTVYRLGKILRRLRAPDDAPNDICYKVQWHDAMTFEGVEEVKMLFRDGAIDFALFDQPSDAVDYVRQQKGQF